MHIGNACDHIALNGVVQANTLDFILKRYELVPLCLFRHFVEGSKSLSNPNERKRSSTPLGRVTSRSPKRFRTTREAVLQASEDPSFRTPTQPTAPALTLRVTIWAERPLGTRRQFVKPFVPQLHLIGHRIVLMKILNISLEVKISFTWRCYPRLNAQAERAVLDAIECCYAAIPLCGIFQVDTPGFINDRLQHDTRMVPVANQNFPKHFFRANSGHGGKMIRREPAVAPGRKFGPDQHA